MKQFYKKSLRYLLVVLCMLGGGMMAACQKQVLVTHRTDTAMGTVVHQTIYGKEQNGTMLAQEIMEHIEELEKETLSWRIPQSEIGSINEKAGAVQGVAMSWKLSEILSACMEVSRESGGAFDITIGEVVRLWDIDAWAAAEDTSDFLVPEEGVLQNALEHVGFDKVTLEGDHVFLPEKMQLDLGAVGKGIALDSIRELLQLREVTGAVISVGGSVLIYGSKPDGALWNVGIVNPAIPSQNVGVLKLTGTWCVSTSGDYERYVEKDNERFHHIIDPKTARPAKSGVRSVTILMKSGVKSDALSTACFILGEEKGMELAQHFGAEALFILENEEMIMTEGMQQYFHLSNNAK